MKKQILSEEFKRMQKIAGLVQESKIDEIGMFSDPIGYDKNASSPILMARNILKDAGLPSEEIDKFISDNMFKKGKIHDLAQEYVDSLMMNENISRISKSDFKNMIREMVLAEAKKDEKEEEEDVEIEDTETVDTEEMPTEETPQGNPDDILDSLKTALDGAKALGDEKLVDQIGNTITFYTRVHIVGQETDMN